MQRIVLGAIVTVLLVGVVGGYLYLHQPKSRIEIPEYQSPPELPRPIEQGWTADQRLRFHPGISRCRAGTAYALRNE
jgi:hypothetical protein